jgi:methyl-accepting chemotaxis protein
MPYSRSSRGVSRFSGLQSKILALVLIPLFLVTVVLVTTAALEQKNATEQSLTEQQRQLTQARKDKVQSIVESTHSAIEPLLNDPALSDPAMRQRAYELLQNVRFDGSNYIWAYAYDGTVTVLGDAPQQIGEDHNRMQGDDGTYIVQGMIETGRSASGFYGYNWEHPDTGQPEPKQS